MLEPSPLTALPQAPHGSVRAKGAVPGCGLLKGAVADSPQPPPRTHNPAMPEPHLLLAPVLQLPLAGAAQRRQSLPAQLPRPHGHRPARPRSEPALPLPAVRRQLPPLVATQGTAPPRLPAPRVRVLPGPSGRHSTGRAGSRSRPHSPLICVLAGG